MAQRDRRPKVQIMAEILDACKKPQSKTHILQQANLSWEGLEKYLEYLQSMEFLQIQHSSAKFLTTQKGLQFVIKWNDVMDLILPFDKRERYG